MKKTNKQIQPTTSCLFIAVLPVGMYADPIFVFVICWSLCVGFSSVKYICRCIASIPPIIGAFFVQDLSLSNKETAKKKQVRYDCEQCQFMTTILMNICMLYIL